MNEVLSEAAMGYLVNTGKQLVNAENKAMLVKIEDEVYIQHDGEFHLYRPTDPPEPTVMHAYTLDGFIEWINNDPDNVFRGENKCVIFVNSPTTVSIRTPNQGNANKSLLLCMCDYKAPTFEYGHYYDSETLGIMIQTQVMEDKNRDALLKVVRNLTEEQSKQTADDGISQRVVTKAGIAEVSSTIFKNPALLRPMRTFPEVEQPQSAFVVRFREGAEAALFEADGGKWNVEAVHKIGDYLEKRIINANIVVVA